MKRNRVISTAVRLMRPRKPSVRLISKGRGQAAVEFALVATVAMIVLFVAVQLALIGEDALALGQMNYQGARWAAVNTCATYSQVANYMTSTGSPSVTTPSSCGTKLTINITDSLGSSGPITGSTCSGATVTATLCGAGVPQRTFGSSVMVQVQFNASSALFLPSPFLGISFPTTLSSTETAMAE